jgi:hypothetical protein
VGWGEEVVGEEGREVGEAGGVRGVYSRWCAIDIGLEIPNNGKCYRLCLRGSGLPSEGFVAVYAGCLIIFEGTTSSSGRGAVATRAFLSQ